MADAAAALIGAHVTGVVSVTSQAQQAQPFGYASLDAAAAPVRPIPIKQGTQDVTVTSRSHSHSPARFPPRSSARR